MKEALFDEIRYISIHKIKNGRVNLRKIVDKPDGKTLFFSHLYERIFEVARTGYSDNIPSFCAKCIREPDIRWLILPRFDGFPATFVLQKLAWEMDF